MMNKVHWSLIWLSVEFGNPSVRAFLISGWWTQMLYHITLMLPRMSYKHQRWTRRTGIPRFARLKEQVLSRFACQLTDYLGRRQTFYFILCVNF